MTDLELIKKCADRMEIKVRRSPHCELAYWEIEVFDGDSYEIYDPLEDDAQLMALVKKFKVCLVYAEDKEHGIGPIWQADIDDDWVYEKYLSTSDNLNRAACECVAKLEVGD